MLDKEDEKWKAVPFWVTLGMYGIKTRKAALLFEYFCFALGTMGFLGSFVIPELTLATVLWASAYWYSIAIRWIDNRNLWQKNT